MRGLPIALVLIAAMVVVACFQTPEGRATAACSTVCACQGPPIKEAQEKCLVDCVGELAPMIDQVGDECLGCIASHQNACTTIELDCEPICQFDQVDPDPPPPEGFPDGGVVVVDAAFPDGI